MISQITGIEFLKEVRKKSPSTPFIFLSTYIDKEKAETAIKEGANDILDKPINTTDLSNLIKKYAQKRIEDIQKELEELKEIQNIFIEEAKDLLDGLDKNILDIEQDYSNKDLTNLVFRKIHTLKGGAGSIPGATWMQKLSHALENSLKKIRDDGLVPSKELINIMLKCIDLLVFQKTLLEQEQNCDKSQQDATQLIEMLQIETQNCESKKLQTQQDNTFTNITKTTSNTTTTNIKDLNIEEKDEGVFVSNDKLDNMMTKIGELVGLRNSFESLGKKLSYGSEQNAKFINDFNKAFTKLSDSLQFQIMEIRKVTLSKAFAKYQRIVRQIAQETNKKINLIIEGDHLSVDKNIAKALGSSLIHAIRNSCDHGIEYPQERLEKNKPEVGTIKLQVDIIGDTIYVTLEDDGKGLNKDKIMKKALERQLISETKASTLKDEEIYELIFLPGFSTAEKVTSVSGRGVGMDVIKTAVLSIHGNLKITSQQDKGTKILIQIPIPKTIVVEKSVLIQSNNINILIPLIHIADISPLSTLYPTKVGNIWTCRFRELTIPLGNYKTFLLTKESEVWPKPSPKEQMVVILNYKDKYAGLLAETINDHIEAVVQRFNSFIGNIIGFKGTTILPDSSIAYIISIEELIQNAYKQNHIYNNNTAA